MQSERPRARRYPFVSSIEVTDVDSEAKIWGQTSDLSLFGCGMKTRELLPKGTIVMVRIVHAGTAFTAQGRVTYAGQNGAMGVVFTLIEPHQQSVLETWITQLRA
jgi:hypothetical protein